MPKKGPSRTALRKSSAKLMSVPDQRTHIRACVVTIYKRVAPGLCARYGDAFVEDEAQISATAGSVDLCTVYHDRLLVPIQSTPS